MSSSASSNRAFGGKPWFRSLAESIPALVWASGSDGLCTYFNSVWLQFTGRAFEESLGNGWLADVHPNDSDRVMNEYNHAFQGRRKFRLEYRLRNKSGRYKWIIDFGSPVFSSDGSFQGYIGSCTYAIDPQSGEPETHWRENYQSAVEETDRENIADRIASAEISIRNRLEQTSDPEEQSILRTCLATIVALKNDGLLLWFQRLTSPISPHFIANKHRNYHNLFPLSDQPLSRIEIEGLQRRLSPTRWPDFSRIGMLPQLC